MLNSGRPSKPSRRRRSGRRSPYPSQSGLSSNAASGPSSLEPTNSTDHGRTGEVNVKRLALPPAGASSQGSGSRLQRTSREPRASYSANNRFNLRNLLSDAPRSRAQTQPRREGLVRSPAHDRTSAGGKLRLMPPVHTSRALARPLSPPVPVDAHPKRRQGRSLSVVPAPSPRRMRRRQRRAAKPPSPLLYATRLLIFGVGVAAIAGTMLSVWNPTLSTSANRAGGSAQAVEPVQAGLTANRPGFNRDGTPGQTSAISMFQLGQPIAPLAASVRSLVAQYPELTAGVFVVDLDNGQFFDTNGTMAFSAASTIKVPILVAFLQDVDAGKIRLNAQWQLEEKHLAEGSGDLQYQPVGTTYTALEVATQMITISDNTATNMVIDRLGGLQALNQRFRSWGMTDTVLNNLLADLPGTNTTSPRDLSMLLTAVSQGDLLSLRSRDRLMEIMQGTVTNTLLPAGLGEGAVIAHKTGNIDTISGDSGIVDVPNGRRYVITAIIKREYDDGQAQELIRQISRVVYEYFEQVPAANTTAAPGPTPPQPAMPREQTTAPQIGDSLPSGTSAMTSPEL